jgi:hypothetical protein
MDMALKTHSVGGRTPHFSGLAIHDTLGEEHLQLHSERDLTIMAEHHKVVNVGVDHHLNVGHTHMTTVGALPGSGGGGGDVTYQGAFNWHMGDVKAELGKSLQLVYGESTSAVAGLGATCVVGCQTDVVINPLAITGLVPLPALAQAVLAPLAGESYFTIGALSRFTYGQTLAMHRGPRIELTGPPSVLTLALAGAAAILGTSSVLAAGVLDPDTKAGEVTDLSLVGGFGLALAALTASEVYDSVKGLTTLATYQEETASEVLDLAAMQASIRIIETIQNFACGKLNDLEGALNAIHNNPHVLDGDYSLKAKSAFLVGQESTLLGAGVTKQDFRCVVSLDPSPDGGIDLRYHHPVARPEVNLHYKGIQLLAGESPEGPGPQVSLIGVPPNEQLALLFNPLCSIILKAEGITLMYGQGEVGCSITMNAEGITFNVGQTTVLELTPEGIKLDALEVGVMAPTNFQVVTGELTEVVDGMASRTAAGQAYLPG